MYLNDLEIFLLLAAAFFFAGFYAWLVMHSNMPPINTSKPVEKNKSQSKIEMQPETPKVSVFESYDYLGTKIYHNDGKYTVVEDNVSRNFNSMEALPSKYRKMILEMEAKKFLGKKNNYYMENKNGKYTVVFPDGRKKNYKNYADIPENLKKILSS